jgi:precorrin-6A/cobalt-precorrin-6A reductase
MVRPKRVLILGGTTDARELAVRAAEMPGVEVITSLAGRTRAPVVVSENTRIGGFGGVVGLTAYLREQGIDQLIDATHPFAAQISFHGAAAAAAVGIPHLMLIRPAWEKMEGDRWIEVDSNEAAAKALPGLARRIFLTIGRQELATFAQVKSASSQVGSSSGPAPSADLWFLMRMIDPPLPNTPVPPGKLLLERGPFSLESERSLLQQYEIDAIVSKNSGGNATYAKIIAARERRLPVVMVQRPPMPESEQVATLEAALAWIVRCE